MYIIQGIDETNETTALPLSVKSNSGGNVTFGIDALENVEDSVEVYLKDGTTFHDLKQSDYTASVSAGITNNRFEIVFASNLLSVEDEVMQNQIEVFYNNQNQTLVIINNSNLKVQDLNVSTILGQELFSKKIDSIEPRVELPVTLQTGVYIFNIKVNNYKITKKILID